MALLRRAYLVCSDTFGTCLDPRRRPRFHSNHPVWLGLAEACHTTTTTTHICVKSKKRVLRKSVTCLCMFVFECVLARAGFVSQSVRVYLSARTERTRHIWDWLVGGGHKHCVSRTSWHALLRHLANCEERFLSGLTYWIFGQWRFMKLKRQQRGHSSAEHQTGILAGEEGKLPAEAFVRPFSGAVLLGIWKIIVTGGFRFKLSMKPE